MGILSFLCKKKSKADQTDTLSRQGIIFDDAKSKHLRLYFESQFSQDMEEDDMEYLKHIFEQKLACYLALIIVLLITLIRIVF